MLRFRRPDARRTRPGSRVVDRDRLQQPAGLRAVVVEAFVVMQPGLEQRSAARGGIEVRVVVAGVADQRRVVDQRVAAVQHVVIQVVLPVFPVVRHDRVRMARHEARQVEARLEGRLVLAHEAVREVHEGRMLLHVQRIHDEHVLYRVRARAVELVAREHRVVAGLRDRDVRFEHRQVPRAAARPIAERRAFRGERGDAAIEEVRRPDVRHQVDRRAQDGLQHWRGGLVVLRQQPHFVERRAVEDVPRRFAEDRGFAQAGIHVPAEERGDFLAERLHVPEPFHRQLRAHFDHDVEFVRDVGGLHERDVEAVEFEAGRQRVGVAAVQKVDGADTIRALEHHREERDVLVYAVFPDRLAVARKQRDADRRPLLAGAARGGFIDVRHRLVSLRRRASGHRVERLAWKRRAVDRHGCMCAGAPRRANRATGFARAAAGFRRVVGYAWHGVRVGQAAPATVCGDCGTETTGFGGT